MVFCDEPAAYPVYVYVFICGTSSWYLYGECSRARSVSHSSVTAGHSAAQLLLHAVFLTDRRTTHRDRQGAREISFMASSSVIRDGTVKTVGLADIADSMRFHFMSLPVGLVALIVAFDVAASL